MRRDYDTDDNYSHKPGPGSSKLDGLPKASPEEIARFNAHELTRDIDESRKGSAEASLRALDEIHDMKKSGNLLQMSQDLECEGRAKVTYGSNGDVQHIVFNDSAGKAVDIDVKNDSINGQSSSQLRDASAKQAKEFYAASFADPSLTTSGKPLSPEAQAAANKLVGALLDGDVDTMTKAAQEIMKDPALAKEIDHIMRRTVVPSPVSFGRDEKGNLYMQAGAADTASVIVPASGKAIAVQTDYLGRPDFSKPADMNTTMKMASDQELSWTSDSIRSEQGYLQMFGRMPADGYSNMASLERAYSDRDNEKFDFEELKAYLNKHKHN